MFPSSKFKGISCPYFPECPRGDSCFFSHELSKSEPDDEPVVASVKKMPMRNEVLSFRQPPPAAPVVLLREAGAMASLPARMKYDAVQTLTGKNAAAPPPTNLTDRPSAAGKRPGDALLEQPPSKRPSVVPNSFAAGNKPAPFVSAAGSRVLSAATPAAIIYSPKPREMPPMPTGNFLPGKPPQLGPDLHSKIERKKRQNVVNQYFTEFSRIYAPLLADHPTLPHVHALQQEKAVMAKATIKTYINAAVSTIRNLKKRPVAVSATDVGIDGEWVAPPEIYSPEHQAKLEPLIAPESELVKHGYSLPPKEPVIVEPADQQIPQEEGEDQPAEQHKCSRCDREFTLIWPLDEHAQTACLHHWGSVRTFKRSGTKDRLYICCQEPVGHPGCSRGPHVFKEEGRDELDRRIPFTFLPDPADSPGAEKVVAIDCEMSYTTAGMELTRLTVLNYLGTPIIDELVKTTFPVLDLNTRWSGISSLDDAKYDLAGIKELMGKHLNSSTIIIGHGLENDLNAMRIYHRRIIDTAILFPHPSGLPRKYPLRVLTQQLLRRFIQQGNEGHDSVEDAKACVDIVQLRVEKGDGLYIL
ncbi:hypothetical protein BC832DRAFT_566943 [Gaertneriomyces semiglobifer]|nr:hypothetical protein BC832DRAFT_566943 [Gaertneriomyces semiglobifer]